jgi:hypothetical protein
MVLDVPDRVHIMPVGFEEDRIYLTAEKLRADKIVLLVNEDDTAEERKHRDQAERELQKRGFDKVTDLPHDESGVEENERLYQTKNCNLFDLYRSLGTIAKTIHQFDQEEVYVNISTGSKVTAIAGMIAAMTNQATAYYVKATEYKLDDVPRGIEEIFELPHYPIDSPDLQWIYILEYLQDNKGKNVPKSDLIDFADEHELPDFDREDISRKGKYRLLDNNIVDPLLRQGYIDVSQSGRNRIVSITDKGEDLLEAFGYMIESWEDKYDPDHNPTIASNHS